MANSNGLCGMPRLTQNSFREAVSATVRGLQADGTDKDMADAWGVSSGTVANARNRNHDLSGMPLLQLGARFGPDSLSTILALIGAKAVPTNAVTVDVAGIPCDVAKTLPLLIECFKDGDCSDADVRTLDQAGAIDCLRRVADMLGQHRDRMRLRSVA